MATEQISDKSGIHFKLSDLENQCGDNCQGECSGEVTGTPFCPQPERDAVLERLHIWFENYCEGNEDPDLWVAFLHAERTLRQKCKEVGNIW